VLKYVIRRLLVLPLIMFFVSLILFALVLQVPAEQRVLVYLPSVSPRLTQEQIQELIEITIDRYGLDRPLWTQYTDWVGNLLRGEWGYSPTWREPVLDGLRRRAPATLELTLVAIVPAIILAVTLGSLAARRENRLPDHLVRGASFLGWAIPPFILALVLMNIFYASLRWFPPERMSVWASPIVNSENFSSYTGLLTVDALLNGNWRVFSDAVRHLVLPAVSLALVEWALLTRVMRSSLLDVMREDYVVTARAKGLCEREVVAGHARRNAILPLISMGGVVTSLLISGIVVIEVVFHFNGVGSWAVRGILQADIPVAVGFALFTCTITVLASLIADLFYAVVDPRVRLF
jgi:peptide/nickel transport system permease protein